MIMKLEMTVDQFEAFFGLAEEMAISIGMTNDDLAENIKRRVKLVNKMLKHNNVLSRINY